MRDMIVSGYFQLTQVQSGFGNPMLGQKGAAGQHPPTKGVWRLAPRDRPCNK
ncbi:hypothetical protein [Mesorhizobium sp. M0800]|uniref:hypothetical protein n=1 Tax=Mesorhizobium sp. M0800 TaxID=2957000 RepID=UPI00333AB1F5